MILSFRQKHGQITELWDLRKAFTTAARVMQRRSKTLTDAHKDFYYDLFEATSAWRRQIIRQGEMRKLRRSASS